MKDSASPDNEDAKPDLLSRIEQTVLTLLLAAMIVLSCLQILLRSVFSGGLLWADPLIRQLVLWSGLLGAAMATARGKHISLDILTYLVPKTYQRWVLLLNHLFSALTATALAYAAYLFLQSEIAYGSPGLLNLPTWAWNLIFPLTFGIIALRYYMAVCRCIAELWQHRAGDRP